VSDPVARGDGLLCIASRAAWQELDDDLLLCVVALALALLGAAPLFPLLVRFAAELVIPFAVLAALLGVVFPVFLALLGVPGPVLLPAGVVAPTFGPGEADGEDDRDDSHNGQHEPGDRGKGCPLQEAEPDERHARIVGTADAARRVIKRPRPFSHCAPCVPTRVCMRRLNRSTSAVNSGFLVDLAQRLGQSGSAAFGYARDHPYRDHRSLMLTGSDKTPPRLVIVDRAGAFDHGYRLIA
jgi:hypothetical protein